MSTLPYLSKIPCRLCGTPTKTLLGVCTKCTRAKSLHKAKGKPNRAFKFGQGLTKAEIDEMRGR